MRLVIGLIVDTPITHVALAETELNDPQMRANKKLAQIIRNVSKSSHINKAWLKIDGLCKALN